MTNPNLVYLINDKGGTATMPPDEQVLEILFREGYRVVTEIEWLMMATLTELQEGMLEAEDE